MMFGAEALREQVADLGNSLDGLRSRRLTLTAIILFCIGVAEAQETEVLFLPQDSQLVDEITIPGTRETTLSAGLSRLAIPGSETNYYVINEVAALRARLREALSNIWQNDSDISIAYDQYRSDFIHLRLGEGTRDARYFTVEPTLLFQVSEFFREGGFANGSRSVELLEYQVPIRNCSGLGPSIQRVEALLQDAVSRIDVRPEPLEIVIVDGIGYQLQVRMGHALEGRFNVGENSGPLFDAVRSVRMAVRECSMAVEPELRTHDF